MKTTQHGRELTGAQMAQMLEEWANGCGHADVAEFTEQLTGRTHRTLQQKVMGAFVAAIESWAKDENGHDLRNEATVNLAKKFVAATGDKYDRYLPLV
jgi:hypothetical protein